MVPKYIRQLIEQGENQHLDFKYEVTDAKKLARTFSAFANTGGGKLLVGVKDNGVIRGIEIDEEAYMLEAAASIYCKPEVNYELKDWQADSKHLLEISVEESKYKPHIAPWKDTLWRAFVRVHDENFVADSIQVAVWKKQSKEKPAFIKYNNIEKKLLDYLQIHSEITVREFCQLCKIKYHLAKKILVNLISIGVLRIHYSEDMISFRPMK